MFTGVPGKFSYFDPWLAPYESRLRAMCAKAMRIAYFYERPDTSTFRYRAFNPGLTLAAADHGASASWFCLDDLALDDAFVRRADALVICRSRFSAGVGRLLAVARAESVPVLFDCDDLVFDPSRVPLLIESLAQDASLQSVWDTWYAYTGGLGATFREADGFSTTNDYLLARAREVRPGMPGTVMRNYLNPDQQRFSAEIFDAKERSGWDRDDRVHIGYFSGSPSHARDFALVAPAIASLMDDDPRIMLRVVGFLDIDATFKHHRARIEVYPLQDFMNLQRLVGEVEIGIVPLSESQFTNCKSELKFFEAAAVGTVTVATPTGPYAAAIDHERTGFLAPAHRWGDVLRRAVALVDNDAAHRAMITAARDQALGVYGWDRQGEAIVAGILTAAGPRRPARSMSRINFAYAA